MRPFSRIVRILRRPASPAEAKNREETESATSLRHCHFCGRSEHEVQLLIEGMSSFICAACAVRACEVIAEADKPLHPDDMRDMLLSWERVGKWLVEQKNKDSDVE
jgi:hypothetical protein